MTSIPRKVSTSSSRKNLSAARLREVLVYNRKTGDFHWRVARGRCSVGELAGCSDSRGYLTIKIDGVQHWAHRLAVLYVGGQLPTADVDHKNGVKSDNRWANLRSVDRSTNLRNQRRAVGKVFGVAWREDRGKWQARIKVDQVTRYLGHFASYEDAVTARKGAEKVHGFDRRHGEACRQSEIQGGRNAK